MKTTKVILWGVFASMLLACENHPKFSNPTEAVEGCHKILTEMQSKRDVNNEELTNLTAKWLETQDSAYSVFGRDTTITLKNPTALAYFIVSDSIRQEITRLAFSQTRTLKDVMFLKLNTAKGRKRIMESETYKEAVKFYEKLDKQSPYPTMKTALTAYYRLLSSVKPFKQEHELITFITEEDKCFRSLMQQLSKVPDNDMQKLTTATTDIFDKLYASIGQKEDDVNDRAMLYLTMRFNRRIIQNAMACRNDIKSNQRLSREQRANYKWMLIQPFMAIDDYSTAVLTDNQREELLGFTEDLPSLLGRLDVQKQSDKELKELTDVLAKYFLKSYLSTTL